MDQSNSDSRKSCGISIVIPVLNEVGNVTTLIEQIISLPKSGYTSRISEIIFIDDGSTDGTLEILRDFSTRDLGIKLILKERKEKHGTVNAQIFGIQSASNDIVIIMDGDLQHPAQYLSQLIGKYSEGFDFVLASRYIKNGIAKRKPIHGIVSRGATFAAKAFLPPARGFKDPISGYFIMDRKLVNHSIEPNGHNKLSLLILSGTNNLSSAEIPYCFKERTNGTSKVATHGFGYLIRYFDELLSYRKYYTRKHLERHVEAGRVLKRPLR